MQVGRLSMTVHTPAGRWPLMLVGLLALLAVGCGHKLGYSHFASPIVPVAEHAPAYRIGDDRSITFVQDRLEVTLLPVTADILNRSLPGSESPEGFSDANPYANPTNPYTYGDWTPLGEDRAPDRFTVFQLKVKNYTYPKVRIDRENIEIVAPNGRRYPALSILAMTEYYWTYAVAYAGNTYFQKEERSDLLRRTMYASDFVFSGQESEGYIVFTPLHRDVTDFTILIKDMSLRFDFRGEPVESIDIPYHFDREVYYAKTRRQE